MGRVIAAAWLLGALVASVSAVPVPKDRAPDLYYPLAKGSEWVYLNGDTEWSQAVTEVETFDGATVVTVQCSANGVITCSERIRVSASGLVHLCRQNNGLDREAWMLKLPHAPGESWTVCGADGDAKSKVIRTTGESEWVDVPAGRFRAVPVTWNFEAGDLACTVREWYAPGVGLVKQVCKRKDGEVATVLRSFKRGGGDPAASSSRDCGR